MSVVVGTVVRNHQNNTMRISQRSYFTSLASLGLREMMENLASLVSLVNLVAEELTDCQDRMEYKGKMLSFIK